MEEAVFTSTKPTMPFVSVPETTTESFMRVRNKSHNRWFYIVNFHFMILKNEKSVNSTFLNLNLHSTLRPMVKMKVKCNILLQSSDFFLLVINCDLSNIEPNFTHCIVKALPVIILNLIYIPLLDLWRRCKSNVTCIFGVLFLVVIMCGLSNIQPNLTHPRTRIVGGGELLNSWRWLVYVDTCKKNTIYL